MKLPILFEDQNVIVIDKPAGLLSQGDISGDPSVVSLLQEYLGRPYVGLVHRLDRNTSGALVIGKRSKAAERLTTQLQNGTLTRTYQAWVEGIPTQSQWEWAHALVKNERTNEVRAYPSGNAPSGAKEALLSAQKILSIKPRAELPKGASLLEIQLETGRGHQIRVQAAFEGHAIIGDPKYGRPSPLIARPALHSWRVSFEHPIQKNIITLEAPIPQDWEPLQRLI